MRATLEVGKAGQTFLIRNPANPGSISSNANITAKQLGAQVKVRAVAGGLRIGIVKAATCMTVKVPYKLENGIEMPTARGIVKTAAHKKAKAAAKAAKPVKKAKVAKPAKKAKVAPKQKKAAAKTPKKSNKAVISKVVKAAPTPDFLTAPEA